MAASPRNAASISALIRNVLRSIFRTIPSSRFIFFKFSECLSVFIPDRAFLEQQIFDYLNSEESIRKILFAGVEIYTLHYPGLLHGKQFYTIDNDAEKVLYGAKDLHTIGSVTDLGKHYQSGQFDCIILNGLIGYGLDTQEDVDRALHESFSVLRPGGLLIIGWNNTRKHLAFELENLPGYVLFKKFAPWPTMQTANRIEVNPDNRHTFDFLLKPA